MGILKEQHTGYIVLRSISPIPIPAGLLLEQFESGTLVTIDYNRDSDAVMIVQGMKRSTPALLMLTRILSGV